MKKVFLLVGLVCMGFLANAQFYAGGSLGFMNSVTKPNTGDSRDKFMGFNIAPEVGYSLSDKMDVGISVAFGTSKMTDFTDSDNERVRKGNEWSVNPYVRYSLVEYKRFKVLGKATFSLGMESGKTEVKIAGTTTSTDDPSVTNIGLSIVPMLTYDISDRFVLFTDLNFLGLGFTNSKIKDAESTTGFGLLFDANDVVNVGAITIGFAYKF